MTLFSPSDVLGHSLKNYDIFLAHGSGDKALVQELHAALVGKGFSVFLDSEELDPGADWRRALEAALTASRCVAVCVGPAGPGSWTGFEISFALDRSRNDPSFPLIPVLLPGGGRGQMEELSRFLSMLQAVDMTAGIQGRELERLRTRIQRAVTGAEFGRPSENQLALGYVMEGFTRLQNRFGESIRPLLAGGQLIERQETQEVLRLLREGDARIVVVHGVAGCGKSGLLLEVADRISETDTPFLPLRLDRHSLEGTSHRFGATALVLPASPGTCLARAASEAGDAVLLLDQLDALRWTGAHSSQAWDLCREVMLEALDSSPQTKIVVCCRTFDLQHDPQLRAWKQDAKDLREVRVGDLTAEQVRAAVDRVASTKGGTRPLDARELELLQRVHHLQMWLTLYPDLGARGSLGTRRALMQRFWEDRRTQLQTAGIPPERIESIEARLVEEMQEGMQLTVSRGSLHLSSKELEVYQSLQILQADPASDRISFCHQSYLDHLVALRIGGAVIRGEKTLLEWLGTREDQSLFRREQLRLVLEELRDRDEEAYVGELRSLRGAVEAVRFHLRLLCLQSLAQVTEPSPAERKLVLELVDDPYWRGHVLTEIVRGRPPWFRALDDAGIPQLWLAGNNSELRDLALEMLLYVVENCGDRVARLLRPYLGRDEDWDRRIAGVLRFDPAEDSARLFELRLELTKRGVFQPRYVRWKELATKHPSRLVDLLAGWLVTFAERLAEEGENRRIARADLASSHLERIAPDLFPAEECAPAWERLFQALMSVFRVRRHVGVEDRVLESYSVDFESLEPVVVLIRDLGARLLEEDWTAFVRRGEALVSENRRSEVLFADSLRLGPQRPDLADWVVRWLMADPWRARLRMKREATEWLLPCQLIERYAHVCSEGVFNQLEEWLLTYREPDLQERYCRRHRQIECDGDLSRPSSFGRTQRALLVKLPIKRASEAIPKRIAELDRKFGPPREVPEIRAAAIRSPLAKKLQHLADHDLLKLVASRKLTEAHRPWRWGGDCWEEMSIEALATDLRGATQSNSERFGKLLARWPEGGHPALIRAIVSGLSSPGEHRGAGRTDKPAAPSHELLEEVLSLPIVRALAEDPGDLQVASNLCDFLERYPGHPWSDEALDFVGWVAEHHPDPSAGRFPVESSGPVSSNDLESHGLNVTRGRAAHAIRRLLFRQPELFTRLRPALQALASDLHPAVRVAAIGAFLPVLGIDQDEAVAWFLEASVEPDEVLATHAAQDFLHYTYGTHLGQLLPTLNRMVGSPLPEVATRGAHWVAAAFLVNGELEPRFEQCVSGTPHQRKGVAQVAAGLLENEKYTERARATLLRLAEDHDEKVAQTVSGAFRRLDLQHLKADPEAWTFFARSRAFQADPTPLLLALEEQSGDLLPFADCVLATGATFAEDLAEVASDSVHRAAVDASNHLFPLLLRLYEQARRRDRVVYQRCLDLWDRLLEQRVGSVMGLTRELDRP